jgi:3-oxoacyl-[acyl-carrier protein] reductase
MTPFRFDGRVVAVTGASKGIGAATATLFGRLGASVAVHCRADEAGAATVADAIRRGGARAEVFAARLERWDAAANLVPEIERRMGPLDVLVVNHGIWTGASIEAMTEAEYDAMLDANLRGVFAVCGGAARAMRAAGRRGSIVLVASTAGQRGEAFHAHYAATKGAIISLTKSLAPELAPAGIRVNCVAPGWVATSMTADALAEPARRAEILASIPIGRVGQPEEIAGPIAFLASSLAAFMTGEILNVNGGAVLCG